MSDELYFDNFETGQEIPTGSYTITKEEILEFASQYDPQYFHLDEEAARHGPFGRLVASGWHTAAVTMKLKAGSGLNRIAGGMVGLGIESVRWPRPVYPDDTLHALITITEKRRSQSKPTHGVVKYRMVTFNQHNEKVMEMQTAIWVPC